MASVTGARAVIGRRTRGTSDKALRRLRNLKPDRGFLDSRSTVGIHGED